MNRRGFLAILIAVPAAARAFANAIVWQRRRRLIYPVSRKWERKLHAAFVMRDDVLVESAPQRAEPGGSHGAIHQVNDEQQAMIGRLSKRWPVDYY